MGPVSELKIWGIRHHGPGSALRLQKVLQQWEPQIILLEAPADAQSLIATFNPYEMKSPIAGLIYDPKQFHKAAYFPLAEFSPEYIALTFAFDQKIPLRCIDLPIGALLPKENRRTQRTQNPFQRLADVAGFEDVEQWWDHFLENTNDDTAVFEHISKLMHELRIDAVHTEETKLRENYMKDQIKKAFAEDFDRIAVICGAYHVPELENYSASTKISKPKMIKTKAAWIPWSYHKMKQESGYGAGIAHPTWYRAIFLHQDQAPIYWITRAGQILRQWKSISTAHTIETIELARSLQNIRMKASIGMPELVDAITAVMGGGDDSWLTEYGDDIFTGNETGELPNHLLELPIQLDFRQQIKKARLSKVLQDTDPVLKNLDLRKDSHLSQSFFFHQTAILDISLGTLNANTEQSFGNFKESWTIQWDPISEWMLIQAADFGNTITSAAYEKLTSALSATEDTGDIIEILHQCFLCGFDDLLPLIQKKLIASYLTTESITTLLDSVLTLLHIHGYGHIRWKNPPQLLPLIDRLTYKSSLVLPSAITQLKTTEEGEALKNLINRLYFFLQSGNHPTLQFYMETAWKQIFYHHHIIDYFNGRAFRIGMNLNIIAPEEISARFVHCFRTCTSDELIDWLEGLFAEGILWVIHDDFFLSQLTQWIQLIPTEKFHENLPLLRRTFGLAPETERSTLFRKILGKKVDMLQEEIHDTEVDWNRVNQLLDYLKLP